ncbi:MAG: response regulator [Roseibium album]|uniref:response regulator n=1 Tax=Roseibium album TaxID=311410 RepID=UPI000D558472|nr:response regulator [Roseibium album]MBG6157653.1 CheY-like chemotaxis protein [Labrenzia sp. EL_162]MBG6163083.1 CheY-like chemotaxis protein [Labrenzia sp. EL_195]MBG6174508.1 CheY-like chemotaxis protein [Labrenzia sp. EL_132]MBG6195954.1 CheY-like chemotaxis protein [Labrenzia sp. EL_159]MBG6208962.1 CheY-like chemotaxis protein [Labrenzia sp. EL_126]MBG6229210.1 CheY-like chemotaxis protein [Labrenzia sp. EL_208]MCR9055782.1 response regulator [Paracoccaceae bacterium]
MARILLTEDDEAVRSFVKRALELDGHSVDVAEDGGEAVETLTREKGEFDLLVSDIKMPVMDGIALALQTARDFPDMPILLMTGFADQRERANGLDALVHDVITKPFSLVDIRKAVRNAIAGELPQETRRYA